MGAPGSGKGSQSSRLVDNLGYMHVSTGNLLREEISKGSELGKKVQGIMSSGQLVSDDIVLELLSGLDLAKQQYIFDGYPRNLTQAKSLETILNGYSSKAVYFHIDTDELVERITNRRVSEDGSQIYNLKTNPPKVEGVCDVTGQELVHRKDDHEEVVKSRMEVYENTIGPVLEFYKSLGRLVQVDAAKDFEVVYNEIVKKIS